MLGVRISLILLALASCSRGDVESNVDPIDDAMPAVAIAAYPPLVGTWSGTTQVPSFGLVTGVVRIDGSGSGTFFVSGAGASRSGTVEILEFANGKIRARALGQERTVPIAVAQDELRLQAGGIGEVVLVRSE